MKYLPLYARRLLLAAGALSLTPLFPLRELAAQGPGVFDAFAARKDSPSDPLFSGIGLTGYSGIFGLRVSGGLNFNKSDNNQNTFAAPQYYRCDRFQCRGNLPRPMRIDEARAVRPEDEADRAGARVDRRLGILQRRDAELFANRRLAQR